MKNVYIIGPSCSGKTTMLHFLRKHAEGKLNIPIRVITRTPRDTDDSLENTFMEKKQFVKAREGGEFFISWNRIFSGERKEWYGFLKNDVSLEKINIFSGNTALLLYPESIFPPDALSAHESYFVICNAPVDLRIKRLRERSPEYSAEEVAVRTQKEPIEPFLCKANLLLDTANATTNENGGRLLRFIDTLTHK